MMCCISLLARIIMGSEWFWGLMYSMLSRMFMMLYYIHVRKNKPMLPLMKSIMELLALSKRRIEDCAFLMYILYIKQ